jgi:transcriptional regulator with XRE-family HTH domain
VPVLDACPVPQGLRGIAMAKDEFAARLRELREQKGMTQAELAEKVGVSSDAVARWERGIREPAWSNLTALADALGVSLDAFRQPPKEAPPRKPGRPKKQPPAPGEPPASGGVARGKPKRGK